MNIINNVLNGLIDIISNRQETQDIQPHKIEKLPERSYTKINEADFLPMRPAVKKIKLVVILLENSSAMMAEKEMIQKIIQTSIVGNKYIIINYSENINLSQLEDDCQFTASRLFIETISDKACLLDVFSILGKIVTQTCYARLNYRSERAIIRNIEIIGIGRCYDNCSKIHKMDSLNIFQSVLKMKDVSTKYFCLDDNNFVNAASCGFRSIGAIHRSF